MTGTVKIDHVEEEGIYKLSDYNKELKVIRSTRMETGCSCKSTKVDKLSVAKMKLELICLGCTRNDVESMSKAQLTTFLKEKLSNCQLCVDNNCHCVQMGIPCDADSCGCLKGGLIRQSVCGNSNGQRVYDSETVNAYRIQYLPATSKLRERIARRASF